MTQAEDRPRTWPQWLAFGCTALVVVVLDQLSKLAVRQVVPVGHHVLAWPSVGHPLLSITHEVNTGVAFGLFRGQNGLLVGLVLAIALGLTVAQARLGPRDTFLRLALALQVGGALGNVVDRLRLGHVIDFIHVGRWPVFNVADSAVSLGTAMLLLYFARHGDGHPDPQPSVVRPVTPSDEPASDLGR